jgi:isoleucyl-tRNA synthetase
MWRNLASGGRKSPGDGAESVHLCDFPQVDEALVDEQLSDEMEGLLDLVTLGSAARNSMKIKVRQPLAEIKVQPSNERERRAVLRFADQISEELNLKKVTLHESTNGILLKQDVKPNMKTLGHKFASRVREVVAALAAADPAEVAAKVQAGQAVELNCSGETVVLDPGDILVQMSAPTDWAGAVNRDTQVLIDCRITEELKREGLAREVVRHVQQARKDAGLEMEDRIVLHLATESAGLREAIEAHRTYIASETLVATWATKPLGGDAYRTTVKVEGQTLQIELRRA